MNSKDETKQEIYDRYEREVVKLIQCVEKYNNSRARLNEPDATQGDYVIYALAKDEWDKQSTLVDEIVSELSNYRK